MSSGTSFWSTWENCSGLTVFPVLDVSSGTNFREAWRGCSGLIQFPLLDTSSGSDFVNTWRNCAGITTFPALDLSNGTTFEEAWRDCSSLTTFPANMFDTCLATNFTNAWNNCALNETSVNNILISIDTAGTTNGTLDIIGGTSSAPTGAGLIAKANLEAKGWTISAPNAFDPIDLSPAAWWDFSDVSSVTTSGAEITDIDDKSGNGWTLSQTTSSQRPTYDTAAINGLNAALWPSSDNDDFLQTASDTFTTAEFYIVAKFANSDFSNYESTLNPTNSGGGWTTGNASDGGLFFGNNVYLNGDNATNRYLDMRPEMSSTCLFRFTPASTLESTTGVVLGTDRIFASLGRGWNGHICEVIAFPSVLSSGDRADLETNLMNKWGII